MASACCATDRFGEFPRNRLLPDFPFSIKYNSPRCPIQGPNWKYDPFLQDFCNKYGDAAPCGVCQKPGNPCIDTYTDIHTFDKFSKAPLFQTSKCDTRFRYQRKAFFDDPIECCCGCAPKSSYCCDSPSAMINRTQFGEDVVCGNCPPPGYRPPRNDLDGPPCEIEFPFEIYQCPEVRYEPIKIRSGVDRCLHPSSVRHLKSTTKSDIQDFYKIKPRNEIELYRSKLAIDKRRKGPSIPCNDDNADKYLTDWPVCVKAKCAKWKGGNTRPTYDIIIPQPMVVQPLDFCIGSLDQLNTKGKKMPVIIHS